MLLVDYLAFKNLQKLALIVKGTNNKKKLNCKWSIKHQGKQLCHEYSKKEISIY